MDQRSIFVMSLIRFEEINGNEFSFRPSEDELEQDIIHGIEVLFRQLGKISTISARGKNRDSWFVKACYYTRMGCDRISLTGSPRASPYAYGPRAVFFAIRRTAATCGRPSANCVHFTVRRWR